MSERNQRERDLAIERLKVRAEMRSAHEIEDSKVISDRASLRVPPSKKSLPPPFSYALEFLKSVPPQHRVWPLLLGMLLAGLGYAKAKGWIH